MVHPVPSWTDRKSRWFDRKNGTLEKREEKKRKREIEEGRERDHDAIGEPLQPSEGRGGLCESMSPDRAFK